MELVILTPDPGGFRRTHDWIKEIDWLAEPGERRSSVGELLVELP